MKKLASWPIIINAALFQITWFACALGSAQGLTWPALLACCALAIYQLQPKRRHPSDLMLVAAAIVLGVIVDTLWIHLGFISYSAQTPIESIAPAWIIILWVGFALTINHSLSWLDMHPLLPAATGIICAPLSYLAGVKFGALEYLSDTVLISVALAAAWAISMTILVRLSKQKEPLNAV